LAVGHLLVADEEVEALIRVDRDTGDQAIFFQGDTSREHPDTLLVMAEPLSPVLGGAALGALAALGLLRRAAPAEQGGRSVSVSFALGRQEQGKTLFFFLPARPIAPLVAEPERVDLRLLPDPDSPPDAPRPHRAPLALLAPLHRHRGRVRTIAAPEEPPHLRALALRDRGVAAIVRRVGERTHLALRRRPRPGLRPGLGS